MRGIGMWDSSSISTLFSGFSSSRSNNAASSFIANMDMTTYSGIRSGSYFKLLKSYYGNNLNSKAQSLVSSSVSTSKDSAKTLASIESESEDMVKSAQALYKNSRKDDTDATYKKDGRYYIVTDRWQTFTNVELGTKILGRLSGYCDEFLVHGVDVEGKASGIEQELIKILKQADIPVTYAGGIGSMEDLEQIRRTGNGKVDFTIGSALDLFGGRIPYEVIKEYH